MILRDVILEGDIDENIDEKLDKSDLDDSEVENFLNHLLEFDDIIEYFQILDHDISIEENLTDEEIINLVI